MMDSSGHHRHLLAVRVLLHEQRAVGVLGLEVAEEERVLQELARRC